MVEKLILLVEHDPDSVVAIKDALEQQGYRVLAVTRVSEFVNGMPDITPDLILLDTELPGISGYGACFMLKDQFKKCPVIMISVRSQRSDIERGFWCGADDYFTKPLEMDVLLEKIDELATRTV